MVLSRYTAIAFGLFALLFPIRITCGSRYSNCSPETDYRGRVQQNHELKPLSVRLVEQMVQQPLPLKYR